MIRSILSSPIVYETFTYLIGGPKARDILIKEYIRPKAEDRILDLGCGPGSILDVLPSVEYYGCDISPAYIDAANKKYGLRGTFICEGVNLGLSSRFKDFDLVIAIGLLHHLDDRLASDVFELSRRILKPKGRLVTIDPCFTDHQSAFVKFMLSRDRGEFVRFKEDYFRLATESFSDVNTHHRTNMLNVPYSHLIMECSAP